MSKGKIENKREDHPKGAEQGLDARQKARAQMVDIASRYYFRDESKSDIGKTLGISRFQVARLLKEAREAGLVTIHIQPSGQASDEMARALEETLAIKRAIVVNPAVQNEFSAVEAVGARLAELLLELVQEGEILGLTWSRVIEVMARQLIRLPPCEVVQLAGAIHMTGDRLGSVEVIRTVAATAQGTAWPIYAPLLLDNADTALSLTLQPGIAQSLARIRELDIAVVSVGSWRPSGSALYNLVTREEAEQAAAMGACGEISGRLYDRHGHTIEGPLDARIVGITVEQLRHVPCVIGTSFGAYRAEATRAAARAGLFDTLIVDQGLAEALLNPHQ